MVGTPHVNNYTLGRGEVGFSLFDPTNPNAQKPVGFRYIGNTPTFSLTVATTDLDHYSSDHGINVKDESITIQIDRTGSFSTDDISLDNLALLFFGTKETDVGTTSTVAAEAHNNVQPGFQYMLGVSETTPAGVRNIAAVTSVTDDTPTTPITYVSGTDYTVDLTTGILTVLTTGTITAGKNLKVSYSTSTASVDRVLSSNNAIEGALIFTAYNPAGNQVDYLLPWCRIAPDGDYAIKGDTWQTMTFKMSILDPKDGRSAIYAQGRPYTPSP